jgi:hypothetical protein
MEEQVDSPRDKLFYGVNIGTPAWKSIWKAHPEWQEAMLSYAKKVTKENGDVGNQMELELKGENREAKNDYTIEVPDGIHVKYKIEIDMLAYDKMGEITAKDMVEALIEMLEDDGDVEVKKISCKETFKKQVYTSLDPF